MESNAGMQKLRAASCSVLLLLLTLALVASSLLVARYAVQAQSWWLSLLAVTVCLLGLCTWIQLAASRAGRWRILLARQIALNRAHAAHAAPRAFAGPGLGADLYAAAAARRGSRSESAGLDYAHIAVIPINLDLDSACPQGYRVPGPPPPPPYALCDLPPSYGAATSPTTDGPEGQEPSAALPAAPSAPSPSRMESPPPYAVAVKRDDLVQEAVVAATAAGTSHSASHAAEATPSAAATASTSRRAGASDTRRTNASASRRPILWF